MFRRLKKICDNIRFTDNIDLNEIEKMIDVQYLEAMESFVPSANLVYTSFDGDFMSYLHDMLEYTIKEGYVPVNPEAALGYYVSTTSHSDEKVLVMMDCIKTELICDYMWIFNPKSGHMPEGVLAELMAWRNIKRSNVTAIDFFPEEIKHIDISSKFNTIELDIYEIENYIQSRDSVEIEEINNKLLIPFEKEAIKNAYIIANFSNYKHIDWARNYCYLRNISPVCAHTLLPYHLYAKPGLGNIRYLIDRLSLMSRTDNMFFFTNRKNIDDELKRLDVFSLCELYYALKYKSGENVNLIGWDEARVPKYINQRQWALTSVEAEEV